MKKLLITFTWICTLLFSQVSLAQVGTNGADRKEEGRPVKRYTITLEEKTMTLGGVTAEAMTVNGGVPGPVLEFTEGDLAIITVVNKMEEETSVHWHGLILPNIFDGVPYLNTPPIKPGAEFEYRIPINQGGTYWYHSHTMLQEQRGVYGSIVIQPKENTLEYDKDLVVVLSDWTNEKPMNVLRNLKRGNEWYQVKKGTAVPLSQAIAQGGLGAQLTMWRDRMEGADIADIYYPAFLSNGKKLAEYPNFKPGEKVRLRFINASASTYFWMDIGAGEPKIVAGDGVDVHPEPKNRFLFAIAETYDVIVTMPKGKLEILAQAQDGSGSTAIHLGKGELFSAKEISKPDKVAMMKQMAKMDMKMGAPALIGNTKRKTPKYLMKEYGMEMKMEMDKAQNNALAMDDTSKMQNNTMPMNDGMHMEHAEMQAQDTGQEFDYSKRRTYFNYNFLKAREKTSFNPEIPVKELLLNLTGNMNRYVWSINGVPLSEADKIKIDSGKITRITLNNLTMMHHPMHLHGHYFRVLNENGEHSPLKHTVNVPPMEKVTIEFYNEEYGDWFFHCHVLYHMMGGMARVFSYDTPRDDRLEGFPVKKLINETDHYFAWGLAEVSSNFSELKLTTSNIRNEFDLSVETDYDQDLELEFNYNRYFNDWVRIYGGVNSKNESPNQYDNFKTVALAGIKYFTPYMFDVNVSIDHQLRPRAAVAKEILLLPGIFLEGEYEYLADFGWVNDLESEEQFEGENEWLIRSSYMVSQNFSIQGNYHSHYGWGGGLSVRF